MAPQLVYITNATETALPTTFNKDVWDKVDINNRKAWWSLAKGEFYSPYIVEVLSFDGTTLKFAFVDHKTGASQPSSKNEHKVTVTDTKSVCWGYPSTVQNYKASAPTFKFGFLMLTKSFTDAVQYPEFFAGGGQGKWPESAFDPEQEKLLADIARALKNSGDAFAGPLLERFNKFLTAHGIASP